MHLEPLPAPPVLVQLAPPGRGGVFDYLQCLKAEWEAQGVSSHVIALSRELAGQHSLAERIAECGMQASQPCALVLHFSGYGYAQRGLCFWLLAELHALRAVRAQRREGLRLVVVFHELFASGPPWRSAFWLSRWQALIAARLARMADALWTNTEQHARWLARVVEPATPIRVRPVFSNVGEPGVSPATGGRQSTAVVFGSAPTRQRVFDELRGHEATLRRLGIEELIEVGNGPRSTGGPTTIPRRHVGRLEAPDLGRLLQAARFGLLDYPSQFLGKSGVFAAYAAHGCVVLDTRRPGPDTDRLVMGGHYLSLPALAGAADLPASREAIAARLLGWYADHRLTDQARDLLALATAAQPPAGAGP
ncbi:MAG: hypothetical protein V4569_08280 [Pseudomonadota bacterium]